MSAWTRCVRVPGLCGQQGRINLEDDSPHHKLVDTPTCAARSCSRITRGQVCHRTAIGDLDRVCEPNPFGRKRPKVHESRRISGLPPAGYHRGFANRVFANWSFANREFANWPRLYNGLRTREVRSNGCSHQGQRCSPNDHEFQHRISCCPTCPKEIHN